MFAKTRQMMGIVFSKISLEEVQRVIVRAVQMRIQSANSSATSAANNQALIQKIHQAQQMLQHLQQTEGAARSFDTPPGELNPALVEMFIRAAAARQQHINK